MIFWIDYRFFIALNLLYHIFLKCDEKRQNSLTLNYSLITYYNIDSIAQNTFDTMIATTASDNVNEGITTDVPEVPIDQGNL